MSEAVGVGIIGCGDISGAHVRGWKELDGQCAVLAACDNNAENLAQRAEEWDVKQTYADYRKVLEHDDIQIVSICTPPGTHLEMIVDSLRAGKWVFCEKPLVGSLHDFDAIARVEEETGCFCTSVFQYRTGIAAERLRKQIAEGVLGRLFLAEVHVSWARDDEYYAVPWRGKWKTELGGTLISHAIHALDTALDLVGPIAEVDMMADHLARDIQCEDAAVGILRTESGALMQLLATVLDQNSSSNLRFVFEHATVESRCCDTYEPTETPWTYTTAETSPLHGREAELAGEPASGGGIHEGQVAEMFRCYREGRRPPASGTSLRRTLEAVTALYKSALTGKRVRLPIAEDDPFYLSFNGGMTF